MIEISNENLSWVNEVWNKIENKLSVVSELSKEKIPYTTVNGVHDNCITTPLNHNIDWWTNGFWPGMMWLMYYATEDNKYMEAARYAEKALDKALTNAPRIDHDAGFIWHLSAGADYRITGNEESKNRNLLASYALASRYNPDAQFIRAWNNREGIGVSIIDCMMNIPLLYWATKEVGDDRFKKVAMHHADKTMNNHIRPDGSVFHTVRYDTDSGEVMEHPLTQGYDAEKSSWSRGQAWALYGFILSYIHTGKEEYLSASKRVAHYFISAVAATGYVPRCDFRAPEEPIIIDTTAGACAACGLIEIAKNVPLFEQNLYMDAALKILKALEKEHCNWTIEEQSILQNGTEAYGRGEHIPIIYGDFFFVEAIFKLKQYDFLIW